MDEKDKRIAKLERDLQIAQYQLVELNIVKYELNAIKRSRFWKLREVFFARHLRFIERVDMLLLAIPGVSSVYRWSYKKYLNMTAENVVNTKQEGPLVSVIIPFYNYFPYIDDCVNSILDQGLGNKVEVIIIEGFSDDGSREKIQKKKWKNTRLVLQDHRASIGENRLRGIEEAKGRYICMLDADDKLAPGYFKHAIELLEREHYDIVYPDLKYFEEDDKEQIMPDFYYDNIFEFNQVSTPSLFRKSFWEKNNIGYSNSREIFEDWDFWMRMAKAGARFKHLNGFYHLYRVHTTSVPSMTDIRLAQQLNKDEKTKEPYEDFIHTKGFYAGRRAQNRVYKVVNPDINITW